MGANTKKTKILALLLALLTVASVFATATYAWVTGTGTVSAGDITASILTQYFHCGDGSASDPFVITRPVHYYNLIYLYQRKEGFSDENYHFRLGYDLDEDGDPEFYRYDDNGVIVPGTYSDKLNMAGYAAGLLPIGTSVMPFNGSFDGNGLTVANLRVISAETINKVDYNTCDVGVFGYLGPDAALSDVYYDNLTIDLTGLDATVNNNNDLHNDEIHESKTLAYVGLIAGHIMDSAICDRVYINRCTIRGGAAAKCEFGYFGVVENAETGAPCPQLAESIKELRAAGGNAGFGGSINMLMLYDRLTAIHRKSYQSGYTYHYLTAKSKYVDEVTGDVTYGDFVYDGTLTAANYREGEGYFSPTEGNFIFGSNNSSSGTGNSRTWSYHYISGLNTATKEYPVTTTVYTKREDPEHPGQYLTEEGICFGYHGYWLTPDAGGNLVSTANQSEAQAFVPEGDGDLYTRYNGEVRYLVPNGTSGVTLSATKQVWQMSGAGEFYVTVGGIAYYLFCDADGNWGLTRKDAIFLTDGNGNFLSVRAGIVTNATDEGGATRWSTTTADPFATGFRYTQNGADYYLGFDNGALVVKNTNTTWTKDANGYYVTSGGEKFYIVCDNGIWHAAMLRETYLSDDNGNYLSSSSGPVAVTNEYSAEDAHPWIVTVSGNGYAIATVQNGTKYYLGNNGGTLTLQTTPTVWNKNGNAYYVTSGNLDYYLTCQDDTWCATPLSFRTIHDGAGHYLRVTGASSFANSTAANATHFYFENVSGNPSGKVFAVVNGTAYYLRCNVSGNTPSLQTATSATNATSWQSDGPSLFVDTTDGKYTYALRYSNGWGITGFRRGSYITDGHGNYLRINGRNTGSFENTTDISQATLFTFDSDGRIHASYQSYTATYEMYLRNNNGTFELDRTNTASSHTQWTIGGNNISNNNRYLIFDGGSWQLSANVSKTQRYYDISVTSGGVTYYMGASGTALTAVTDASQALRFTATSGNIGTEINGTTYYLNITTADNPVLSLSRTAIDFTNRGNRLYISETTGILIWQTTYYYSVSFNSSTHTWEGIRSQDDSSGTQLTFSDAGSETVLLRSLKQDLDVTLPAAYVSTTTLSAPAVYEEKVENVPDVTAEEDGSAITLDLADGALPVVEKTAGEISRTGTYFPLRTELHDVEEGETYTGSDPYGVSPQNTGYIIGGNYETDSVHHSDIRVSEYSTGDISASYFGGKLTTVYTNDKDGRRTLKTSETTEEYYGTARDQFLSSIVSNRIYGLHFMNSEISMDHLIEAESATLFGKTYQNYQFPEDCIDFRTVEAGYISFFGGTYFNGNDAFFSLHEIFRDDDKKITAIYEIKLVCAKYKQEALVGNVIDTSYKYLYVYYDPATDTTFYLDGNGDHVPYTADTTLPDSYQIVFDTEWITNPANILTKAVYYFRIPCNVGEYALGSVKGKTGAYLMYLDIGTNGGDIMETIVSTAGNVVTDKFDVDVRNAEDAKADYAILQMATDVPVCGSDDFSFTVSFDESRKGPDNVHFNGIYTINVVNNTEKNVTVYALLCDDDDDLLTPYGYAYELIYTNGDHTETVYASELTDLTYWQMAAGFVIPASGKVTEVDYLPHTD